MRFKAFQPFRARRKSVGKELENVGKWLEGLGKRLEFSWGKTSFFIE